MSTTTPRGALLATVTATAMGAALLSPVAIAHEDNGAKDRTAESATWTRASVLEAEVVDASDSMSFVTNITYDLRYGEPVPHGTDIEFATLGATEAAATLTRVAGADRIATAAQVAAQTFDAADTVIIARSDQYADALAGAPLATQLDAPLLLTDSASLSPATADEIERLGASDAILLGGPVALSADVESAVEALGLTTRRIAGENRFATAAEIDDELPTTDRVLVVEGVDADPNRGWPDALSASGYGAVTGMPILLVDTDRLPEETAAALGDGRDATIIGGTVAVSDAVQSAVDDIAGDVDRIAGDTRYDTSALVATRALTEGASTSTTWVATGRSFADGLVAGPAVGKAGGILVLVDGQDPDGAGATLDLIEANAADITDLFIAGGTVAVSDAVRDRLADLVAADDTRRAAGGGQYAIAG